VASEKFEAAKAQAMVGYLDPGPNHLNCAQTVLRCCLVATDGDPDLIRACAYLGGGMARMGQVCGALSGAAVALGLCGEPSAEGAGGTASSPFDRMQDLIRRFEAEFGAVTCRDLLGCDISTAEGFRHAKKTQATKRCPEFVEWTCDRLGAILDLEEEDQAA
jgi:C_GCAxxG_C_C family probable redox protein